MKKLLLACSILLGILLFALMSSAEVVLTPNQQIQYELCGAGWVASAITEVQSYPAAWRAAQSHGNIVQIAQARIWYSVMSGGITKTFPLNAFTQFLNKFQRQSLRYGPVYADPEFAAPTGCSVVSSNIECDVPTGSDVLYLFSWNFVKFTDTELTADVDGDFDSLSSGNYVVSFGAGRFSTTYLTIP